MADDISSLVNSVKDMLGTESGQEKLVGIAEMLGQSSASGQNRASGQSTGGDFSQLNPEMLHKIGKIYSSMTRNDDKRIILLNALKPFMKTKRIGTLDMAVKVLNLSKISGVMKDADLFK